jgi:signal transduction histidine kinase
MSARHPMRLAVRLILSYAVVITLGAAAAYLTVRLLVPPLFDERMRMGAGSGGMMGPGSGGGSATHAALISALNTALLVAVLVSVVTGGVVAAFVTRRLLRPLSDMRAATRRIAGGDYRTAVVLPREPELAALAADVNTLAASLGRTEARRTQLLGDVAHEMRTPLTSLDGYVEALIDGVLAPEPRHLQAMAEELHRLHRLADDLAALSRTEEQRVELHPTPADLAELAQRAASRLRPQFQDADVTLSVRSDAPLPVHVDVDRVMQVLTNLLGNALTATPAGGSVTVVSSATGGSAVVTVADTGVGLAADDQERVFERFYRATTALRRSTGSGIGLTIARGLARAHGGDVQVRSTGPGQGATALLSLPLRRAVNPRDAGTAPPGLSPLLAASKSEARSGS